MKLNGVPVNYLSVINEWLPRAGNLPGESRYRCIIEPLDDTYFSDMVSTEGITNTRLNNTHTEWGNIIRIMNTIFNDYIKCKGVKLEEWMVYTSVSKPKPEPLIVSTKGNIFICNIGEDTYHYGYTTNTNIEKEKPKIIKKLNEVKERQLRNLEYEDNKDDTNDYNEIDLDTVMYEDQKNIHFIYSLMLTNPSKSGQGLELFLKGIKAIDVNPIIVEHALLQDQYFNIRTLYGYLKNNNIILFSYES